MIVNKNIERTKYKFYFQKNCEIYKILHLHCTLLVRKTELQLDLYNDCITITILVVQSKVLLKMQDLGWPALAAIGWILERQRTLCKFTGNGFDG